MSVDGLRELLERVDADEEFRQRLVHDPQAATAPYDVSNTERYALVANDEDALRRLVGTEVSGYAFGAFDDTASPGDGGSARSRSEGKWPWDISGTDQPGPARSLRRGSYHCSSPGVAPPRTVIGRQRSQALSAPQPTFAALGS